MAKARLSIEVSEDLARLLDELADSEDVTRTEIVRRAISVMKAFSEQRKVGRTHLGVSKSPEGLDAELIGVLTSEPPNRGSQAN